MGKEYELPWTCDTSNKIKSILVWAMCITAPISLGLFVYEFTIPDVIIPMNPYFFYGVYGVLGTIYGWIIKISDWEYDDKLPTFRCKQQKEMSG